MPSFCLLIALAAYHDLEIHHLDVKTSFLHGDLLEEIYMQQPELYKSSTHPTFVYRLHKSLYGLKQSPRMWYHKFHHFMTSLMGIHALNRSPTFILDIATLFC